MAMLLSGVAHADPLQGYAVAGDAIPRRSPACPVTPNKAAGSLPTG